MIQRFSENLDLRIDPGIVTRLEEPDNWTSGSSGQKKKRVAYFEALGGELKLPDIALARTEVAKDGRGAEYEIHYPGTPHRDLEAIGMRPFVLVEAGRARVTPFVRCTISSLVHDLLAEQGEVDLLENRLEEVRCVHPLVTLLDKLDAISKRYGGAAGEESYARHYEDAARIISGVLPPLDQSPAELAAEMLATRDISKRPDGDDEAFGPSDDRLERLDRACARMDGMYWGERMPISDCGALIREWIRIALGRSERGAGPGPNPRGFGVRESRSMGSPPLLGRIPAGRAAYNGRQ